MLKLDSFKDLLKRPILSEAVLQGRYGKVKPAAAHNENAYVTSLNPQKYESILKNLQRIPSKGENETTKEFNTRLKAFNDSLWKDIETNTDLLLYFKPVENKALEKYNKKLGIETSPEDIRESAVHYLLKVKRWLDRQNDIYPELDIAQGRGEKTGALYPTKGNNEYTSIDSSKFWDIPSISFLTPIVKNLEDKAYTEFLAQKDKGTKGSFIRLFQRFDESDAKNWIAQRILFNLDIINKPRHVKRVSYSKSNKKLINKYTNIVQNAYKKLINNNKLAINNSSPGVELADIVRKHSTSGFEKDFAFNPYDFLISFHANSKTKNKWDIFLNNKENLVNELINIYTRIFGFINLAQNSKNYKIGSHFGIFDKKDGIGELNTDEGSEPLHESFNLLIKLINEDYNLDNLDDLDSMTFDDTESGTDSDDQYNTLYKMLYDTILNKKESGIKTSITTSKSDEEVNREIKIINILIKPENERTEEEKKKVSTLSSEEKQKYLDIYNSALSQQLSDEEKEKIKKIVEDNYYRLVERLTWAKDKKFTPGEYSQLLKSTETIAAIINDSKFKSAIKDQIDIAENKAEYSADDYISAIIKGIASYIESDIRARLVDIILDWEKSNIPEEDIKAPISDEEIETSDIDDDDDDDDKIKETEKTISKSEKDDVYFYKLLEWINDPKSGKKARFFRENYKKIKNKKFNVDKIWNKHKNINSFITYISSEQLTTYLSERVRSVLAWLSTRFYMLGYKGSFMENFFRWLSESNDKKAIKAKDNLVRWYNFTEKDYSAEKYPTLGEFFDELYLRDNSLLKLTQEIIENKVDFDTYSRKAALEKAKNTIKNAEHRLENLKIRGTLGQIYNLQHLLLLAGEENFGKVIKWGSGDDDKKSGPARLFCKTLANNFNKLKSEEIEISDDQNLTDFINGLSKIENTPFLNFTGKSFKDTYKAFFGSEYVDKIFDNISNYEWYVVSNNEKSGLEIKLLGKVDYDKKTNEVLTPIVPLGSTLYKRLSKDALDKFKAIKKDRYHSLAYNLKSVANYSTSKGLENLKYFIDESKADILVPLFEKFIKNASEKVKDFVYGVILRQFRREIGQGWSKTKSENKQDIISLDDDKKNIIQNLDFSKNYAEILGLDVDRSNIDFEQADTIQGEIVIKVDPRIFVNTLIKLRKELLDLRHNRSEKQNNQLININKLFSYDNFFNYYDLLLSKIKVNLENFISKSYNISNFTKGKINNPNINDKQPWPNIKIDIDTDDSNIGSDEDLDETKEFKNFTITKGQISTSIFVITMYGKNNILYNLPQTTQDAKDIIKILRAIILTTTQEFYKKYISVVNKNLASVFINVFGENPKIMPFDPKDVKTLSYLFAFASKEEEFTGDTQKDYDILTQTGSTQTGSTKTINDITNERRAQIQQNRKTRLYNLNRNLETMGQQDEPLSTSSSVQDQKVRTISSNTFSMEDEEEPEDEEILMTLNYFKNPLKFDNESEYESNKGDFYKRH